MKNAILMLIFPLFLSVNNQNSLTASEECMNESFDAMDEMLDWGYTSTQASCMGNVVYAACEGWPVSLEQAEECFN